MAFCWVSVKKYLVARCDASGFMMFVEAAVSYQIKSNVT